MIPQQVPDMPTDWTTSNNFAPLAQVHNTPDGHVTRDYRKGVGKLADLQFLAIDTSGQHFQTIGSLHMLAVSSTSFGLPLIVDV